MKLNGGGEVECDGKAWINIVARQNNVEEKDKTWF